MARKYTLESNASLIGIGLFLIILTPAVVALYAALTGTRGLFGVILATMGTWMLMNFYNVEKDGNRLLALLLGPALVAIGLYIIIRF